MKSNLCFVVALGLIVGLFGPTLGSGRVRIASADGPIGGVDPLGGSLYQTFTLGFRGFEPNAVLTLSFLPPNGTRYLIVENPTPFVSDSKGEAGVLIDLPSLLGYSTSPNDAATAKFATIFRVVWGPGPSTVGDRFHVDACDEVSCVDLVGALAPISASQ